MRWLPAVASRTISFIQGKEIELLKVAPTQAFCDEPVELILLADNLPVAEDLQVIFTGDNWRKKVAVTPNNLHGRNALWMNSPILTEKIASKTKVKIQLRRKSNGTETKSLKFHFLPSKNQEFVLPFKDQNILEGNFKLPKQVNAVVLQDESKMDRGKVPGNDGVHEQAAPHHPTMAISGQGNTLSSPPGRYMSGSAQAQNKSSGKRGYLRQVFRFWSRRRDTSYDVTDLVLGYFRYKVILKQFWPFLAIVLLLKHTHKLNVFYQELVGYIGNHKVSMAQVEVSKVVLTLVTKYLEYYYMFFVINVCIKNVFTSFSHNSITLTKRITITLLIVLVHLLCIYKLLDLTRLFTLN